MSGVAPWAKPDYPPGPFRNRRDVSSVVMCFWDEGGRTGPVPALQSEVKPVLLWGRYVQLLNLATS